MSGSRGRAETVTGWLVFRVARANIHSLTQRKMWPLCSRGGLGTRTIKSLCIPRTRWHQGPCLQGPTRPNGGVSWSQRQIRNYKLPPPPPAPQWIPIKPECEPVGSQISFQCFPAVATAARPQPCPPATHCYLGGSASPQS